MRFGGGGHVRDLLIYARLIGIGLLIALMLGFALEALATYRANARDLMGPRWRLLSYWGLAFAIAALLFYWVALHR
ncbi:MAG TPA: hypothetical protein VLV55_02895 [Rhizomicrobium sp.]|nr:hypothetical protein [Rhizomicrobium sp.]